MSCPCCDNRILKSDATVAVVTSNLVMTTSEKLTPINEGRVEFRVTNAVPVAGNTLPLKLSMDSGTTTIDVYDKFGNIMYGYGIRPYTILKGYYGTNGASGTAHFIAINYPFMRYPRGC